MYRLRAAFLAVSLLAVLLAHWPAGSPAIQVSGAAFSSALGQGIRWSMFAPDSRDFFFTAWAVETDSGFEREIWRFDVERRGYSHRQAKWLESMVMGPSRWDELAKELRRRPPYPKGVRIFVAINRVGADNTDQTDQNMQVFP